MFNLLNELDTFELKQKSNTQNKATQTEMFEQKEEQGFMPACPVHKDVRLNTKTNEKGWVYVKCPQRDCLIFCGEGDLNTYLHTVHSQLHKQLKIDQLKCFCRETPTLRISRSEKNSGKLYMACGQRGEKCNVFQWADFPLTKKNAEWLDHLANLHPSRDVYGYPKRGYDYVPNYPPQPPVPMKEYNDKDLLWDEVQATKFCMVDSTNKIVSPPELHGLHCTPDKNEELLQLLYKIRSFKAKTPSWGPMELEFHKRAAASGLTG